MDMVWLLIPPVSDEGCYSYPNMRSGVVINLCLSLACVVWWRLKIRAEILPKKMLAPGKRPFHSSVYLHGAPWFREKNECVRAIKSVSSHTKLLIFPFTMSSYPCFDFTPRLYSSTVRAITHTRWFDPCVQPIPRLLGSTLWGILHWATLFQPSTTLLEIAS